MNDLLLRLFSGSIIAAGAFAPQQGGVFAGRNRTFNAVPRVGGDVTGTTPGMTFTLEESNALASGYAQIPGTQANIAVAEMWGLQAAGGAAAAGAKPEIPRVPGTPPRYGFTTTKDYVRATVAGTGTTPSLPNVTIYLEPTDTTSKISGS